MRISPFTLRASVHSKVPVLLLAWEHDLYYSALRRRVALRPSRPDGVGTGLVLLRRTARPRGCTGATRILPRVQWSFFRLTLARGFSIIRLQYASTPHMVDPRLWRGPMVGTTVSHYKILEHLGGGGMGVVYKAQDLKLDRPVALKFLPPELLRDAEAKKRFVHEARAASALQHNNICTVHDIDETDDGQMFIVMDLYEGETLKKRIERGPLKIEDAVDIAMQVGQGLFKAHEHGIVHRDIKPANIMVTSDGVAKIVDFGLAKLSGQTMVTKTGSTLGTAAYMSPEQARGQEADQRSDIWALGVVVYEMLTGRNPFAGEYAEAVTYRILNEDPEFVSKIRPEVPKELEHIVERTTAKDPARRFQTVGEFCAELRALPGQGKEVGRHKPFFGHLGRRQRKIASRVLSVSIILLAVLAYLVTRGTLTPGPVSIALLPLENISGEQGQEWFTDGMTDALITSLARIKGLRVTQRASAMKFRGTNKSASEVGTELGVSYVLEGSVMRSDDQVKITIRLIDAPTNKYLWAEEYARDFTGLLALQGEVAKKVASQIQVTLTREEQHSLTPERSVNPKAYEACLKGNFFLYKLSREALGTALQYFERAAEIDSTYAPAFAGIALVWGARAQMGFLPMSTTAKEGRWAEEKALALDSSLAEIHYVIGVRRAWMDWNWDAAERYLRRAIELKPNFAEARAYYSQVLFIRKRPSEAMEQIGEALKLDPFGPVIQSLYAMDLMYVRRYDQVIERLRKTLETSPMEPLALTTIRSAYHQKKMYNEALEAWRLSYEARRDTEAIQVLRRGRDEGGYSRALQRLAEMLIERSKTSYVTPWQIATLYTRAGMNEEALVWFQKAYDAHDPNMPYLNVDPIFDGLRNDERFQAILKRMDLLR
jgi:serine/threonine protein kinase/TolB-like protein